MKTRKPVSDSPAAVVLYNTAVKLDNSLRYNRSLTKELRNQLKSVERQTEDLRVKLTSVKMAYEKLVGEELVIKREI